MRKWTRREFLKHSGMSAVVAPILQFWPDIAQAAEPKKYLVLFFFSNGKTASNTFITKTATGWNYGPGFTPLDPFKSQTIAFQNYGFSHMANGTLSGAGAGHAEYCATMFTGSAGLTGTPSCSPDLQAKSPSIDQVIAWDYLKRGVISDPLRKSLNIEFLGSTFPCKVQPFLQVPTSYQYGTTDGTAPMQPVTRLMKPSDGFKLMFNGVSDIPGTGTVATLWSRRRRVVDVVFNQAKALRTYLPTEGVEILEKHIQSLSELEAALISQEQPPVPGLTVPPAPPEITVTPGNHERLFTAWTQLIDAAFRFDRTRIVTFQFGGSNSRFNIPSLNMPYVGPSGDSNAGTDFHSYTHYNEKGVDNFLYWFSQRVAELCTSLRGGGTKEDLLAHSMVISGWEFGRNHDARDLPVSIIGGGGGTLNTGQAITLSTDSRTASIQHVGMLTTVVQTMGCVQVNKLGSAKYQSEPLSQMLK